VAGVAANVAGLAEFDAISLRKWHQTGKIAPAAKFERTDCKIKE
jgi:hypothetical protein